MTIFYYIYWPTSTHQLCDIYTSNSFIPTVFSKSCPHINFYLHINLSPLHCPHPSFYLHSHISIQEKSVSIHNCTFLLCFIYHLPQKLTLLLGSNYQNFIPRLKFLLLSSPNHNFQLCPNQLSSFSNHMQKIIIRAQKFSNYKLLSSLESEISTIMNTQHHE